MVRYFHLLLLIICSIIQAEAEKPIVIVIPSYNNIQYYQQNLTSIIAQKYTNWRIIYIDDCSSDGTGDAVADFVSRNNLHDNITVIRNAQRRGALYNHYYAIHRCEDHEIMVHLDGDDWFAHDQVLQTINAAYQDPNVWLTYGQYVEYPSGKKGVSEPLPEAVITCNGYREYKWVTSAPRTFYAGLAKRIQLKDLLYEGDFFQVAADLALMFPILEMADGHISYIDEILYVYNCDTPYNDFKQRVQQQLHTENVIRARTKYEPVVSYLQPKKEYTVAIIELSDENVAYLADELQWLEATHILLLHNSCLLESVDLQWCVVQLERTGALGFYFNIDKTPSYLTGLCDVQLGSFIDLGILYAWQFHKASGLMHKPYQSDGVLYRKDDLIKVLQQIQIKTVAEMQQILWYIPSASDAIGLCYKG